MNMENLLLGYDLIEGGMQFDNGNFTNKIHVVNLNDGTVTSIETGIWYITLHEGNALQNDDGTITLDITGYFDKGWNPFTIYQTDNLKDPQQIMNEGHGSRFSRVTLDIKAKTANFETLLDEPNRGYDLPQIHPDYWGSKKNCFTYLQEFLSPQMFDEPENEFSFPITKYDHCNKKIAAKWSEPGTVSSEMRFIPDRTKGGEDDGVIMTQLFDF